MISKLLKDACDILIVVHHCKPVSMLSTNQRKIYIWYASCSNWLLTPAILPPPTTHSPLQTLWLAYDDHSSTLTLALITTEQWLTETRVGAARVKSEILYVLLDMWMKGCENANGSKNRNQIQN